MKKILTISLSVLALNVSANWGNSWDSSQPFNFGSSTPWGGNNNWNAPWGGNNNWGPWNNNGWGNNSGPFKWNTNSNSWGPFGGNSQPFNFGTSTAPWGFDSRSNSFGPMNNGPWNYGYNRDIPASAEEARKMRQAEEAADAVNEAAQTKE